MKLLLAAIAFSLVAATPLPLEEPADWVLENCVDRNGNPTNQIASGTRCDLKNQKTGTCLVRQSHEGQADWDFATCTSKPRSATISASHAGVVSCNETVALKLGHEYFRKCRDPQSVGINICSESANSPAPMHFDWRFQGCRGLLRAGQALALFNVSRKDAVVYAKRHKEVVDTCWADHIKFTQCTTSRDK